MPLISANGQAKSLYSFVFICVGVTGRIAEMTQRTAAYLLVFWLMQVIAQVFFKWGSTSESRWLWGFLGGNLFGFSSMWLLMLVYKAIHPNTALGIAVGGAFLLSQIALVLAFKSKVAPVQWAGVAAIAVGIIALAAGSPGESGQDAQQVTSPDHHSASLDDGR
jgi:multidrug transporter EmrE-like cation transporter